MPDAPDELDALLGKACAQVLARLRQKATLADGDAPDQPPVAAAAVSGAIDRLMATRGGWRVRSSRRRVDAWSILHAGLLRVLAGASFVSIARRLDVSAVQARRLADQHRRLLADDEDYGRQAASASRDILDESFAFDRAADAVR